LPIIDRCFDASLTEFHRSLFLSCTFAYIVHQLVLSRSRYAHVLHLFLFIVSQFQLQFPLPLMFLTRVLEHSHLFLPRRHLIPCTKMLTVELYALLEERETDRQTEREREREREQRELRAPSGRSMDLFIALTTGRLERRRSRRRKLPTVAEQYRPGARQLLPAEVTSSVMTSLSA